MRYLQSNYLNKLALADKRLTAITDFSEVSDILLVEEADLIQLDGVDASFHLLIMTENKNTVYSAYKQHKVVKCIYKYEKSRQLIAQIFNENFSVIYMGATFKDEELIEDLIDLIQTEYVDVFLPKYGDRKEERKSLLYTELFLEYGKYHFITNVGDLLDPPVQPMREIIREQSKREMVTILNSNLSSLDMSLMELSDFAFIFCKEYEYAEMLKLHDWNNKIIPILHSSKKNLPKKFKKLRFTNTRELQRVYDEIMNICTASDH